MRVQRRMLYSKHVRYTGGEIGTCCLPEERTAALHREMAECQRLEREARRAAHFTLLGRLAASVSHEIHNPLGTVFLHMDLLAEEL